MGRIPSSAADALVGFLGGPHRPVGDGRWHRFGR